MKLLFIVLFALLSQFARSQRTDYTDMTGVYFFDKDSKTLLNICESNEWFFTNCITKCITFPENMYTGVVYDCDTIVEEAGLYYLEDSILYLLDMNNTLQLKLIVCDTMNLQVKYTRKILSKGDYLNRVIAYFPGHVCSCYLANFDFFKWEVLDNDEICIYHSLGGIFRANKKTIKKIKPGYWRSNVHKD